MSSLTVMSKTYIVIGMIKYICILTLLVAALIFSSMAANNVQVPSSLINTIGFGTVLFGFTCVGIC
jgi:hypothetical protein